MSIKWVENIEVVGWGTSNTRHEKAALESWEKSDSQWRYITPSQRDGYIRVSTFDDAEFWIGPNDRDLMKRLRNAGTDHRSSCG